MFANQMGMKDESTYGTGVVPDRFYEYTSETMKLNMGRTKAAGLRSGLRVERTDRFLPYRMGASGNVTLDVPTKGFGKMLKHVFGTAAIGTVTDSNYTQTFTLGTKLAKFFTLQFNRQLSTEADQAFTYEGCKILAAEFAIDPEGVLTCSLDIDAEDETTATALATAVYTSDFRVFSFVNGTATIAAAAIEMTSFKVRVENPFNVDRRFIRGNALKKEPLENGPVLITATVGLEFLNTTQYARFQSATAAGALGAVVGTFDCDVNHGGATVPRMVFTMPNADFAEVEGPNATGNDVRSTVFTCRALYDGSSEAITVTYRTTDAAE